MFSLICLLFEEEEGRRLSQSLFSHLVDIKFSLTCAQGSYHLALSTNSTNYINKANMIIVYMLSVLHSIHMHERDVSTLSTKIGRAHV